MIVAKHVTCFTDCWWSGNKQWDNCHHWLYLKLESKEENICFIFNVYLFSPFHQLINCSLWLGLNWTDKLMMMVIAITIMAVMIAVTVKSKEIWKWLKVTIMIKMNGHHFHGPLQWLPFLITSKMTISFNQADCHSKSRAKETTFKGRKWNFNLSSFYEQLDEPFSLWPFNSN